jgi:pre-mRNA-splicing factor SYF2
VAVSDPPAPQSALAPPHRPHRQATGKGVKLSNVYTGLLQAHGPTGEWGLILALHARTVIDWSSRVQRAVQPKKGKKGKKGPRMPKIDSTDAHAARLQKLQLLREKMENVQEANKKDVFAEHRRKAQDPRESAKLERKRLEAEKLVAEKDAQASGKDLERIRNLKYTAEDVEVWDRKVQEKKKASQDLDYGEMAARKYNKLIDKMKPDLTEYHKEKEHVEAQGRDYYDSADTLNRSVSAKPNAAVIDRVVDSVNEQYVISFARLTIRISSRENYSRRRKHKDDEDVTYINDRNMRFNKKLSRAYDKHTQSIKDDLERGTAL